MMRNRAWGAELDNGTGSFRLWAPGTRSLILRLAGTDHVMDRLDDGWFGLDVSDLAAGTSYGFVLPDGKVLPDPASQLQQGDVHGLTIVVDHDTFAWRETDWGGRPWEEAVIYELHIGAFTPQGTFAAAAERFGDLTALGITAIELMPVVHFAGSRGWGYDGVLPYAPHPAYGTPVDLKRLVDAAHAHGLMVLLDVVYNHFGPEGNYLAAYAPEFFNAEHHTPWGAAIAYERPAVRRFFIDNAIYWLDVYRFDGLRFDAIDHIRDELSGTDILVEMAQEVRNGYSGRQIHLTTEDNRNVIHLHPYEEGRPSLHTAEWNDDFHNVVHVIATGESEGYYRDFASDHFAKFARVLAEGFAYQGEISDYGGTPRGVPSAVQPPQAFVDFLQNHDQIGNRAFGERLLDLAPAETIRALTAILLLSPHIPLLFMGEEWGERRPFSFFTDFTGELADAVRQGRRREFADFVAFHHDVESLGRIPDPNDLSTFEASRIDWATRQSETGREWLGFYRDLLEKRAAHVVPLLKSGGATGRVISHEEGLIAVDWTFSGGRLELRANLGDTPAAAPAVQEQSILIIGAEKFDRQLPRFGVVVAGGAHGPTT